MGSYADRLNELDKQFNDAETGSTGFKKPPIGVHQAKIAKASLREIQNGKLKGELSVDFQYKLNSGEVAFKNITITGKYSGMGLSILKGDLETLGFKIKSLNELQGAAGVLRKCAGMLCEINIVESKKDSRYVNIYLNKVIEEVGSEDDIEELEEEEEEEEKPKPKPKKKAAKGKAKAKEEGFGEEDDAWSDDLEDFSIE